MRERTVKVGHDHILEYNPLLYSGIFEKFGGGIGPWNKNVVFEERIFYGGIYFPNPNNAMFKISTGSLDYTLSHKCADTALHFGKSTYVELTITSVTETLAVKMSIFLCPTLVPFDTKVQPVELPIFA